MTLLTTATMTQIRKALNPVVEGSACYNPNKGVIQMDKKSIAILKVLAMLLMRPMTQDEICAATGRCPRDVRRILSDIRNSGWIVLDESLPSEKKAAYRIREFRTAGGKCRFESEVVTNRSS